MMRRWNASEAVHLIETEKVNVTGGVPTIAWQLLEEAETSGCDIVVSRGEFFARMPELLSRRLEVDESASDEAAGE